MQLLEVEVNGQAGWFWALSKWEATVFSIIGKNKKSPEDDQAVRFEVVDGKPYLWATDSAHLVCAQPKCESPPPDGSMYVKACSLKPRAGKLLVKNMMLIPWMQPTTYTSARYTMATNDALPAEPHGDLDLSGPCNWDVTALFASLRHLPPDVLGMATPSSWNVAGRFAHTLAAVAKATEDADHIWIASPTLGGERCLEVSTKDVHGAEWVVCIAPLKTR